MKKHISLFLALLLVLILASCGQSSAPAASTPAPAASTPAPAASTPAPAASTPTPAAAAPADSDFPLAGKAVKDGKPLYLGYVGSENASGWMSACLGYAESVWTRAGGKYSSTTSDSNAELELTQFNDLIELKPDIIWTHPTDSFAISPAVEKARAAGIPVFAIDMAVSGTAVDCFIHLSQEGMGANVGQYFKDYFSEDNPATILEIGGSVLQQAAMLRNQGFHSVVDGVPYLKVVNTIYCEWSNDLAMNAVQDAFEANPEINAIYTHSDAMLNGIVQALQGKGLLKKIGEDGHIVIGSIDCDPVGVKNIRDGFVDVNAEHSPPLHVAVAANLAIDLLVNGKDIPNEVVVGSVLRDKSNIDTAWGALDPNKVMEWPYEENAPNYYPIP